MDTYCPIRLGQTMNILTRMWKMAVNTKLLMQEHDELKIERTRLRTQRDEALEALRSISQKCDTYRITILEQDHISSIARAVLDKYKEGE